MVKKKFGQNLNKLLVQPEAPQVAESGGLLLLSTGKSVRTGGQQSQHDALLSAVNGSQKTTTTAAPAAWGKKQDATPPVVVPTETTTTTKTVSLEHQENEPKSSNDGNAKATHASTATAAPSWDDYGGRGGGGRSETNEYMKQRAREKAKVLQQQEEARQKQQSERAAARLRELEAASSAKKTSSPKTIWQEPAKAPDSSMVSDAQQQPPPPPHHPVMIHLNSYDDRDRGEAPKAGAPRMLYDPKSGSMVAVKAPAVRKERKERKKKDARGTETKQRNGRKEQPTPATTTTKTKNGKANEKEKSSRRNKPGSRRRPNVKKSKEYGQVALFTGVDPQTAANTGMKIEATAAPVYEVVRADDKMELLTGEESPTLKPTAKVFAPSQAAIAAAAAIVQSDEDEDEKDDSVDGLGFDPTQDMDGLMESPSKDDLHADLDLGSLQLGPPVDDGPRHIFAFGSAGTWGDPKGASDWQVPASRLFKTDEKTSDPLFMGSSWAGFGGVTSGNPKDD